MDYQTRENQRICQALVEREVIYCVSQLIHHLGNCPGSLEGSGYTQDDLCAMTIRLPTVEDVDLVDDGTLDTVVSVFGEQYRYSTETAHDYRDSTHGGLDLDQFAEDVVLDDCDPIEAYEHWIVSSFLHDKLEQKGQLVGELFGMKIWGRTCTGQAIHLDHIIGEIAEEMGILHGQKYE